MYLVGALCAPLLHPLFALHPPCPPCCMMLCFAITACVCTATLPPLTSSTATVPTILRKQPLHITPQNMHKVRRCRSLQHMTCGYEMPLQSLEHCTMDYRCTNPGGALARRVHAGHLFLTIPHSCLFLPPPHQTIWSSFSPCLRIRPILCTQLMTMARVVVGSGGSDILCC